MQTKELTLTTNVPPTATPAADPSAQNLDAVREAGQNFLEAGDAAIERALSGDSQAFLAASRQQGGE